MTLDEAIAILEHDFHKTRLTAKVSVNAEALAVVLNRIDTAKATVRTYEYALSRPHIDEKTRESMGIVVKEFKRILS